MKVAGSDTLGARDKQRKACFGEHWDLTKKKKKRVWNYLQVHIIFILTHHMWSNVINNTCQANPEKAESKRNYCWIWRCTHKRYGRSTSVQPGLLLHVSDFQTPSSCVLDNTSNVFHTLSQDSTIEACQPCTFRNVSGNYVNILNSIGCSKLKFWHTVNEI